MSSNNKVIHDLFTIILYNYIQERKSTGGGNKELLSLLSFTCLTQTALNGLLMIKLFSSAVISLGITEKTLLAALLNGKNTKEVRNLYTYYGDCQAKDGIQHSGMWCRIYDNNYYCNLKLQNSGFIATVLARIHERATNNPGIWTSQWATIIEGRFEIAKEYADKVYEYFIEKIDLTGGSTLMTSVIEKAKSESASSKKLKTKKGKNDQGVLSIDDLDDN